MNDLDQLIADCQEFQDTLLDLRHAQTDFLDYLEALPHA